MFQALCLLFKIFLTVQFFKKKKKMLTQPDKGIYKETQSEERRWGLGSCPCELRTGSDGDIWVCSVSLGVDG